MVSDLSGRLQLTHSLRMCSGQRRKSVGVVFMGLGFRLGYRLTMKEVLSGCRLTDLSFIICDNGTY